MVGTLRPATGQDVNRKGRLSGATSAQIRTPYSFRMQAGIPSFRPRIRGASTQKRTGRLARTRARDRLQPSAGTSVSSGPPSRHTPQRSGANADIPRRCGTATGTAQPQRRERCGNALRTRVRVRLESKALDKIVESFVLPANWRVTDGARTRDLRSHNPMLCLLSYGHQARGGFYQE